MNHVLTFKLMEGGGVCVFSLVFLFDWVYTDLQNFMYKIENQDYFKGKAQIEILKTELLLTLSPAKGEKVVSEHVHALFTHN